MTPRYFFPPPPLLPQGRKYVLLAGVLLLFAAMTAGPARVEQFREAALREADIRQGYKKRLFAHRGAIVDSAGRPLAVSVDVYDVRADMAVLAGDKKKRARLQKLVPEIAEILGVSPETLARKFEGGGRAVLLKKSLPPARARRLAEFRARHKLDGLRSDYDSKRYYPQKEYAASVVGYTDYEDVGRSGIELVHHEVLREENGGVRGVRARTGVRIAGGDLRPPRDGKDITLSIDSRLQFYAYEALREAAARHGARGGAAVVMEVQTGEILAMASYPGFNPNNIGAGAHEKNHALTDSVEPGSLTKPFIVALAIEQKKTRPGEMFPADKPLSMGGKTVRDSHIREPVDLTGVLQKSSNVGAAVLAGRLGKKAVWELYKRLEFGGKKVLGMPGEATGRLNSYKTWGASGLATHSYGYGFSTTLLQMLAGYSVFAADGERVAPRLGGSAVPPFRARVFSASAARRVRAMMETAAMPGGTAAAAAVDGYRVAGKTGTALKAENGGYAEDKYRAFFVGMAPASSPRYIAAVMIDEPSKNGYGGGAAAAPVFREVMRRALRLNAVPPDRVADV